MCDRCTKSVRAYLLSAEVRIVSAGVSTLLPTIFIRAGSVTLGISRVRGIVIGTFSLTCLCSRYGLAYAANWVHSITFTVNVIVCAVVSRFQAAVFWTVPVAEGDITTWAGASLLYTNVATFVLDRVTFQEKQLYLQTGVSTLLPTLFIVTASVTQLWFWYFRWLPSFTVLEKLSLVSGLLYFQDDCFD